MICVELFGGEMVYDYLPGDADYPFVFIGEQFSHNERWHKDNLDKQTQVTVHIYHNNWRQRGTVTKMMFDIEKSIIKEFGINGELITTQLLPDNSTGTSLMHATLEPDIKI